MQNFIGLGAIIMHKKRNTVLVVDNEAYTKKILTVFFDGSDFKIINSDFGRQAIRLCASTRPDIVLLELSLPDIDGKDVIAALREWSQVPIIIISARDDDNEVTAALNLGADDYIVKPFNIEILAARINACLRKSAIQKAGEPELYNGNIRMDLVSHQVFVNDRLIGFTPKEYDLLRYFIVNRGKMLTHREILMEVWGSAHSDDKQYLRVFIGQIREKIEEDPASPQVIVTEPGIDYRMKVIHSQVTVAA